MKALSDSEFGDIFQFEGPAKTLCEAIFKAANKSVDITDFHFDSNRTVTRTTNGIVERVPDLKLYFSKHYIYLEYQKSLNRTKEELLERFNASKSLFKLHKGNKDNYTKLFIIISDFTLIEGQKSFIEEGYEVLDESGKRTDEYFSTLYISLKILRSLLRSQITKDKRDLFDAGTFLFDPASDSITESIDSQIKDLYEIYKLSKNIMPKRRLDIASTELEIALKKQKTELLCKGLSSKKVSDEALKELFGVTDSELNSLKNSDHKVNAYFNYFNLY